MTESAAPRGLPLGTTILTPGGPVPAEDLAPGMLVIAVSGAGAPFQAIAEVRRGQAAGPFIRIRAGALAEGAPQDDLLLPAGHGLLLDGALIAAGDLVDGCGILQDTDAATVEVVDLVLAGHDAVIAAGASVETALPQPADPPCAPRRAADGPLRAALAWRAETLGWVAPAPAAPAEPSPGTLRERLSASALVPALPPRPLIPGVG